jgi:hypothetical protein
VKSEGYGQPLLAPPLASPEKIFLAPFRLLTTREHNLIFSPFLTLPQISGEIAPVGGSRRRDCSGRRQQAARFLGRRQSEARFLNWRQLAARFVRRWRVMRWGEAWEGRRGGRCAGEATGIFLLPSPFSRLWNLLRSAAAAHLMQTLVLIKLIGLPHALTRR